MARPVESALVPLDAPGVVMDMLVAETEAPGKGSCVRESFIITVRAC